MGIGFLLFPRHVSDGDRVYIKKVATKPSS